MNSTRRYVSTPAVLMPLTYIFTVRECYFISNGIYIVKQAEEQLSAPALTVIHLDTITGQRFYILLTLEAAVIMIVLVVCPPPGDLALLALSFSSFITTSVTDWLG